MSSPQHGEIIASQNDQRKCAFLLSADTQTVYPAAMQKTVRAHGTTTDALHVVCLVLENENGAILATRRPPHKHLGGLWEFPGGKIEHGETAEAALRREIIEELNLELGPLQPLPPVEHRYDTGTVRLIPFRCVLRAPVFHLTEHTEARWLTRQTLRSVEWTPADVPILARLQAPERRNDGPAEID